LALKKYQGSCHCKKVKFEAEIDLQKGTYKCNCSYCAKVRNWGHMTKPSAIKWTSGQSDVATYQINPGTPNEYYFCKHCGVRLGTKGFIEEVGGDYYSVTIATLDNITPEELAELSVQCMDGANNDWYSIPKETKHL
jgi:hypothetical protein